MYLYINTTERDSFEVALVGESGVIRKKTVQSHRKHSEKLLASITQMLKQAELSLRDIQGIAAVKGPGSFTSLRIGITTANALAYGLSVPIAGIDKSDNYTGFTSKLFSKRLRNPSIIVPEYGLEPHITESKK